MQVEVITGFIGESPEGHVSLLFTLILAILAFIFWQKEHSLRKKYQKRLSREFVKNFKKNTPKPFKQRKKHIIEVK